MTILVSIDRKSLAPQENAQKQCAFGGAFLFSKFPGACIIIFMCGYNSFCEIICLRDECPFYDVHNENKERYVFNFEICKQSIS